ncbi:MAG: YebC/PmpR family DNA-binding transcriptional regulator, partial [bacterium]|nr:YebC/PmpR family DNA-binding transcriptional regulator [bacterium]
LYEGFGPEKVALMVEVVTDNKQRTAASIKNIFEKGEGGLGVPGTVAYFFRKIGVIGVNKDKNDLDKIMLLAAESGAEDIAEKGDSFEIYTDPDKISAIKEELLKKGLTINSSELTFIPKNPILLSLEKTDKVNRFISELEDLSEVQRVYTNYEEAKSENI